MVPGAYGRRSPPKAETKDLINVQILTLTVQDGTIQMSPQKWELGQNWRSCAPGPSLKPLIVSFCIGLCVCPVFRTSLYRSVGLFSIKYQALLPAFNKYKNYPL